MHLYELIDCLQKIENAFGSYIQVHIKYADFDECPLFGIVPEKLDNGEWILILE